MSKAGVVGGVFGLLLIAAIVYFSLGIRSTDVRSMYELPGPDAMPQRLRRERAHGCADGQRQCLCLYYPQQTEGFLCNQTHQHG